MGDTASSGGTGKGGDDDDPQRCYKVGDKPEPVSPLNVRVENQRRRLSVSQSAAVHDSDEEHDRGTAVVLTEANSQQDILRSLSSPKNRKSKFSLATNEMNSSSLAPPADEQAKRLSIAGCLSSSMQEHFENKEQEMRGSPICHKMGIGYACKKGLKPESPNQDDFFIFRFDEWGLYGVFDGHGPYGHDVANFVQRELPRVLYDNEFFWTQPLLALKSSFTQVHNMLITVSEKNADFDCNLSGTTATVVLHFREKLYVAHVGDSRCVIARRTKGGRVQIEATDLTQDHKPNLEPEKHRIIQSGGQVRRLEGDIPHRVFVKNKLYPGLAMSRAIGDIVGCQAGVIPIPDVVEVELDPHRDLFMVMCSDGVWEFMSSQEAVDLVARCGLERVQEAAESLAVECWQRWITEEGNVVDDITAEVIYFFPDQCTTSLNTVIDSNNSVVV